MRTYNALLRLYPRDYRAAFSSEMSRAFENAANERRQRGGLAYPWFLTTELSCLAIGAAGEWIAKLTTSSFIRGRALPDRLRMRPAGVAWESYYAGEFVPDDIAEVQQRIDANIARMVPAVAIHDFATARKLDIEEQRDREILRRLRAEHGLVE